MATKKKKLSPSASPTGNKISYEDLFIEIITVLRLVTNHQGITKDEHLHALPRLGLMTTAKNQSVAATLSHRPKIKAVGLKVTTADVGVSDKVMEFQTLCWGKIPSANKA